MTETSTYVARTGRTVGEAERLAALRQFQVLDSGREWAFDRMVGLVAQHYGCPEVFLSLLDEDRCWIKSSFGADVDEVPRELSLCSDALAAGGLVVYPDLAADPRTRDNLLVTGDLKLRFYAGATIETSSGHRLGVLSIADTEPRELEPESLRFLEEAARVFLHLLEYRKSERELEALTDAGRHILEGTASGNGRRFMSWTVHHLVESGLCDHAFVGELRGESGSEARILSAWGPEGELRPFRFELRGTPCEPILTGETCAVGRDVCAAFPDVGRLQQYAAEGLLGLPLLDSGGAVIGLLFVLSSTSIPDPALVEATLGLYLARLSGELERKQYEDHLRLVVEGTAARVGDDFFRSLTRALAEALDTHSAFVCELVREPRGERSGRVRTLALTCSGEDRSGPEYELAGTPCAEVYRISPAYLREGVSSVYATDAFPVDLGAESYLGVVLEDSEGQPVGHLAVVHDRPLERHVSSETLLGLFAARAGAELERRRTDRRRLQAERALAEAQKEDSLGTLAGGVAHDFNNLLMGILGNVELALTDGEVPEAARGYLTEIQFASRRAAELANQMLAYSGRGAFVVAATDPRVLVEEMGELLQASIPKKVQLVLDCAPELPDVVCDATQIRQVLMNLVLNAAESIGDAVGRVRIRIGVVTRKELQEELSGEEEFDGDHVLFEVEDDGPGMDAATLARVFDPYFSTKMRGRGLGLAAVQGIVRGHHGILSVESHVGVGTTFRVLLPADESTERSGAAASARAGRGRVLVVDDESGVRSVAVKMLERLGHRTLEADQGPRGIELLEARTDEIALVLLDLAMPLMDGREVLSRMRAIAPELPVVLMSGYDECELRAAGDTEEVAFLKKPFTLSELAAVVAGTEPGQSTLRVDATMRR